MRRIIVRQGTRFRVVRTDDLLATDGFQPPEADPRLRWTNGDAVLPPQAFAGFAGPPRGLKRDPNRWKHRNGESY